MKIVVNTSHYSEHLLIFKDLVRVLIKCQYNVSIMLSISSKNLIETMMTRCCLSDSCITEHRICVTQCAPASVTKELRAHLHVKQGHHHQGHPSFQEILWLSPRSAPLKAFSLMVAQTACVVLLACLLLWNYRMSVNPRDFVKRRLFHCRCVNTYDE